MAALQLASTMAGLGTRLATITGLRVHDSPPLDVSPPAGIVAWPDIDYDQTKGRGSDLARFEVHIIIGLASERIAADRVGGYLEPAGASSVKAAIEGDKTLGGVVDSVQVATGRVQRLNIAGIDYIAATFTVTVYS